MLRRLHIHDFVIVSQLELELDGGFGVLTGETGAGKSILLDALGLLLGDRADPEMVREAAPKAELSAFFDIASVPLAQAWCRQNEIPLEDDEVLLRRIIERTGRSRAWINGVTVTLGQLRTLGDRLAGIHGQHAHLALLRSDAQRNLLDVHANAQLLAQSVEQLFRRWQQLLQRLMQAREGVEQAEQQRAMLAWQIDEVARLDFDYTAWQELNAEQARLAHAVGLIQQADAVIARFSGEHEYALETQLSKMGQQLDDMQQVDHSLVEVVQLVQGATIQLEEALHGVRHYRERLEVDPQRLEDIDQKISQVLDIARKYRLEPQELPRQLAEWQTALAAIEADMDCDALAREVQQAEQHYRQQAEELSVLRQTAAQQLSTQVSEAMQALAMSGGQFAVHLSALAVPSAGGLESVEFQVSASAHQPLRPLAKVASGGELSRIGLAIQMMLSRDGDIPTLIFDEVDVGIGGGVAEIVGQYLQQLGQTHQVLCVTHLPQVAACARWQCRISKHDQEGETVSEVIQLDRQARIEEIARMLGGVQISETTLKHAEEMLMQH